MNKLIELLTLQPITDGMKMIDNAFYTDQEKSEQKGKLLDDYRPFKKYQRVIAIEIVRMFRNLFYLEIAFAIIGVKLPIIWEALATINGLEVVTILGWSFLAVVSLYFTGGVMSSAQGLFTRIKK